MRVVCDNCRAVYKIPDSKLIKPVNKATCRNCGHRMLIPRPPAATEDERTLVTNNPMTPHGAIPRAGGPPTVPIQENEPEHTLPIQGDDKRRFTPDPPGRRVAGGRRGRGGAYGPADDDDVPMLPGTPLPRSRGAGPPPRPSGPHVAQPPEEKTSWVRNPPPSAFSDTNEALRAAERGMKPSEEPTRVNAANPLLTPEPATPKIQKPPPPPTPPKARQPAPEPAPRKKPVSPDPTPRQDPPSMGGHSYPGHLGPSHDPSNDMLLALLGAIGAIIGITLLALNPRLERIELELALRAIALMLAFSGAFTNALVLITSSRGRRPARQVLSIVLAGMLATFGVTSAIGLNTLAYMWKTGGLSFTSAPTASLPPDVTPTLEPDDGAADGDADADTDAEPEVEEPPPSRVQPDRPRTQPPRTQPDRPRTQPDRPRTQPRDPDPPPREVITVPSDDGLGDDDFGFDDDPPPRRDPDPPPRRDPDPPPASGGMDSVPMEVIDIQLRNNIAVKKCFFQHMQSAGSLPPRVDVRFTLEPDGNVSRAAITQAAFAGSSLDRCLSTAIKGITFPPTSGAATKITFPFIFE